MNDERHFGASAKNKIKVIADEVLTKYELGGTSKKPLQKIFEELKGNGC